MCTFNLSLCIALGFNMSFFKQWGFFSNFSTCHNKSSEQNSTHLSLLFSVYDVSLEVKVNFSSQSILQQELLQAVVLIDVCCQHNINTRLVTFQEFDALLGFMTSLIDLLQIWLQYWLLLHHPKIYCTQGAIYHLLDLSVYIFVQVIFVWSGGKPRTTASMVVWTQVQVARTLF